MSVSLGGGFEKCEGFKIRARFRTFTRVKRPLFLSLYIYMYIYSFWRAFSRRYGRFDVSFPGSIFFFFRDDDAWYLFGERRRRKHALSVFL